MTNHTPPSTQPCPRLQLTTPSDLIEVIPYVLGFHPTESLVVVALRGDPHELLSTMRIDLATAQRPDLPVAVARALRRDRVDAAFAVVYGSSPVADGVPHVQLVRDLAAGLADEEIVLLDGMYVHDQRWWSYESVGFAASGTPLPAAEGRTSTLAAAAAYAGLVALPDRESVAAALQPDEAARARIGPELARAAETVSGGSGDWRTALIEELRREVELNQVTDRPGAARADDVLPAIHQVEGEPPYLRAACDAATDEGVDGLRSVGELDDARAARFLAALADRTVRDACCEWSSGPLAEPAIRLWCQLARRATPPYDVAPLTLVGWTAWTNGQGALARIAVERALASDPACLLALLLEEAMDRGLRPP